MEAGGLGTGDAERDRLRVKKKAVEAVLLQCQRALELLSSTADDHADDVSESGGGSSAPPRDEETDDLCDLLKSRIECSDFLKKLEGIQASVPKVINEDSNAWDMVSENDLWEGGGTELDQEDYIFVRQEDIVEGLACFMATYLLSVKPTKDLTPNQLQEALSKTFSVKKKKGKLRKAWDGSKVIYNVASWGATAVGIYQNPVLLRVASTAFCTSCHVISKLF